MPHGAMEAVGSSWAAMLKDWNASYWLKFHDSNIPWTSRNFLMGAQFASTAPDLLGTPFVWQCFIRESF